MTAPIPDIGGEGSAGGSATGSGSSTDPGLIGGAAAALIAPIEHWMQSTQSGLAHTLNVILNNMWYYSIALAGIGCLIAGIVVLVTATPAGKAVSGVAGKALKVAK